MRAVVVVVCVLSLVGSGCTARFGAGARSSPTALTIPLSGSAVLSGPTVGVSSNTEAILWYVIGGVLVVGGGAMVIYDATHDINNNDNDNFDANGLLVIVGVLVAVLGVGAIVRGVMISGSSAPPPGVQYRAPPPQPPGYAPWQPAPAQPVSAPPGQGEVAPPPTEQPAPDAPPSP